MGPATRPAPLRVTLAFACVYLIWGSTYLAIRFAIETMPPLLMVGVRYVIAGAALWGFTLARGEAERPTGPQCLAAAALGALFFLAGNGGVAFAETRIPSGLTALVVAAIPAWIVLIDWLRPRGARPTGLTVLGVLLGFTGVWLLVGRGRSAGAPATDPVAVSVLVAGSFCWAVGTVASRFLPHARSHLQSGGMQMLAGGALLCAAGLAGGEGARVHLAAISPRSALALLYLIVAGSLGAFTAYNWLLHVVPPARVGTYAFVNPPIAVFLGWALGGEAVGPDVLVAGAVIVAGVVLIITARSLGARARA